MTQPLYRGGDFADVHAVGDYTSKGEGTTDFAWGPRLAEDFFLSSFDVVIVDGRIRSNGYGGQSAPLSRGIQLLWRIDGEEIPAIAGVAIRRNREWVAFSDAVEYFQPTSGEAMLRCRIALSASFQDPNAPDGGRGILFQGHRGDRAIIRLSDDFTFLVDHVFVVRGGLYLDWISKRNQSN